MVWSIPVTSGLESRTVTWSPDTEPKVWTLNAGVHQLIIRGREANARLGQITLRVGSPPPTPTPTATSTPTATPTATSTPTATPTPDQCEVPNFIGTKFNQAQAPGTMLGSRQRSLFYLILSSNDNISPGRVSPRGSSAPAPKRRSPFNSIPQGSPTHTLPPTPSATRTPTSTSTPTATPTAWLAHIEILVGEIRNCRPKQLTR